VPPPYENGAFIKRTCAWGKEIRAGRKSEGFPGWGERYQSEKKINASNKRWGGKASFLLILQRKRVPRGKKRRNGSWGKDACRDLRERETYFKRLAGKPASGEGENKLLKKGRALSISSTGTSSHKVEE